MAARDPRVTEYIRGCAPFARPILRHLRRIIHAAHPGIEEAIKWGMPSFEYRGTIVCGFAGFSAHCALWFRQGRALVGAKRDAAMGDFGRITNLTDLPSPARLAASVRKAVRMVELASRRARTINAVWHKAHPMPPRATLDQRVAWHLAHRKACACRRALPATIAAELKRRGIPVPPLKAR